LFYLSHVNVQEYVTGLIASC